MRTHHVVAIASVLWIAFNAVAEIPKSGYAGALGMLALLGGVWFLGGWYQAAEHKAFLDDEDDKNDVDEDTEKQ